MRALALASLFASGCFSAIFVRGPQEAGRDCSVIPIPPLLDLGFVALGTAAVVAETEPCQGDCWGRGLGYFVGPLIAVPALVSAIYGILNVGRCYEYRAEHPPIRPVPTFVQAPPKGAPCRSVPGMPNTYACDAGLHCVDLICVPQN